MKFLKRIFRRIAYELKYVKLCFVDLLTKGRQEPPKVISIMDTLDKIIECNSSIGRYGEGELYIIEGKDIPFQKYDPVLGEKLKYILAKDEENFMVGLYDVFGNITWDTRKSKRFWTRHIAEYRSFWYSLLDLNKVYYNARISRFYLENKHKEQCEPIFSKLGEMWDKRDLIIVEGEFSRLGIGNNLFDNANSIKRILGPSKNAFDCYTEILEYVSENISHDSLIILALGPTATVMAYDLHQRGFQAMDLGHVDIEYEWYLMKATKKVAIKGKYTNEAKGGRTVGASDDELYHSQIVINFALGS